MPPPAKGNDSPVTPLTENRRPLPDNSIPDRPSTGTPAPCASRLSVFARTAMARQIIPEISGAIFMSSCKTRYECFERSLFGLPRSFAEFVRGIKAGMTLFLFEYEERKLYGVFEAISDGAMDIVPNAYRQTGKLFPAQVRFSIIWNCRPLLEEEFCDAIKENYYTDQKFSFGLSQKQVNRLLSLFASRKVRVQKSLKRESNNGCLRPSYKLKSVVASERVLEKDFSAVKFKAAISSEVPKSISDGENAPTSSSTVFCGTEDFIPLSEESEDLDSPTGNMPRVKGMYSDVLKDKTSIFSRLEIKPKAEVQKPDRSTTRISVFSRLSFASVASTEERDVIQRLDESLKKIKKQTRVRETVAIKEKESNTRVDEFLTQTCETENAKQKKRAREVRDTGRKLETVSPEERTEDITRYDAEQHISNQGSVGMWVYDEPQNKKRLIGHLSKSDSSDDKPLNCRSPLNMQVPSEGSYAGKGKRGGCEVSIRCDALDDLEICSSQKDTVVPSAIDPVACGGDDEEDPKPLITYQRRRRLSASPSCMEVLIGSNEEKGLSDSKKEQLQGFG